MGLGKDKEVVKKKDEGGARVGEVSGGDSVPISQAIFYHNSSSQVD
jgi:hypothetical protein